MNPQESIFEDFFDEHYNLVNQLRLSSGKLVKTLERKLNSDIVENLAGINEDLRNLLDRIELLDALILNDIVPNMNEEEERRLKEHNKLKDILEVFMPSIITYSLKNDEEKG